MIIDVFIFVIKIVLKNYVFDFSQIWKKVADILQK